MNALIDTILSPNSSMITLFAFAGLLVFGLTMFFYKWLLAQGGGSISSPPPILVAPDPFGQFLFHHAALYNVSNSRTTIGRRRPSINNNNKGLQPSVISSIPQFVFGRDEYHLYRRRDGLTLECVICLSAFEDGDEGRRLGCCGNEFHLECIDLWLRSHTTCPICRARPDVICTSNDDVEILSENNETSNNSNVNYEECFDMRVRVEDPTSMLEIVVEEAPNVETIGSKVNRSI